MSPYIVVKDALAMFVRVGALKGFSPLSISNDDAAAWAEILSKIDSIYDNLDASLSGLERETSFASEVRAQYSRS